MVLLWGYPTGRAIRLRPSVTLLSLTLESVYYYYHLVAYTCRDYRSRPSACLSAIDHGSHPLSTHGVLQYYHTCIINIYLTNTVGHTHHIAQGLWYIYMVFETITLRPHQVKHRCKTIKEKHRASTKSFSLILFRLCCPPLASSFRLTRSFTQC